MSTENCHCKYCSDNQDSDLQCQVRLGKSQKRPKHKSDLEKTAELKKSRYYKKFGKRSGRRMERRGKNKKVCRDSKHLPW